MPGQLATNLEAKYTPDGLNRYAQVNATGFTYDANGNLTSDGANAYVYDPENRLVSVTGQNNATLTHDPLGRLWEVRDTATNGVRRMLYDGDDLIAEYDGAGAMIARYVHGTSPGDDPLVNYSGSAVSLSNARFYYRDRLGSVVMSADINGGNIAAYAYDEFGVPGSTAPARFGFTGQAWVPEAGLYYYKARMYSPTPAGSCRPTPSATPTASTCTDTSGMIR